MTTEGREKGDVSSTPAKHAGAEAAKRPRAMDASTHSDPDAEVQALLTPVASDETGIVQAVHPDRSDSPASAAAATEPSIPVRTGLAQAVPNSSTTATATGVQHQQPTAARYMAMPRRRQPLTDQARAAAPADRAGHATQPASTTSLAPDSVKHAKGKAPAAAGSQIRAFVRLEVNAIIRSELARQLDPFTEEMRGVARNLVRAELTSLSSTLELVRATKADVQRVKELDAALRVLEERFFSLDGKIGEARADASGARKQVDNLDTAFAKLEGQCDALDDARITLEASFSTVRGEVSVLRESCDAAVSSADDVASDNIALRARLQEIQDTLETVRAQVIEANDAAREAERQVARADARLTEAVSLGATIERLSSEFESLVAGLTRAGYIRVSD